jgi:pimeloyl-ACP methyl ester carboxylesterase
MRKKPLAALSIAVLLMLFVLIFWYQKNNAYSHQLKLITEQNPVGFLRVKCWFTWDSAGQTPECYYMKVPENHADLHGKFISFPVILFRSHKLFKSGNPVLHLGAGGPGTPLELNSLESVKSIVEYYDGLSLQQGRDLLVMDPRGSGLSIPLLTCSLYVDNEVDRLKLNLSIVDEWTLIDEDYKGCINYLSNQDVNFNFYNSLSIARDVEMMREAAGIKKWVLIGVSYASIYAQFITRESPETVEALLLDSSAFPNLKAHHKYVETIMARYNALFNACQTSSRCDDTAEQLEKYFWQLHRYLNDQPIEMEVNHPYTSNKLKIVLNGERFLGAVFEGIYGTDIFDDFKQILVDLSKRETKSILPYLDNYLSFLLSETYGDISMEAHYCYEDKPFTDYDLMRKLADNLPEGYIRDINRLAIDWPDNCDLMDIAPADSALAEAADINVPTLFLHGELDTITPLADVMSQKQYFKNSEVITFQLSHDILGTSACAEIMAAYFLQHKKAGNVEALCGIDAL